MKTKTEVNRETGTYEDVKDSKGNPVKIIDDNKLLAYQESRKVINIKALGSLTEIVLDSALGKTLIADKTKLHSSWRVYGLTLHNNEGKSPDDSNRKGSGAGGSVTKDNGKGKATDEWYGPSVSQEEMNSALLKLMTYYVGKIVGQGDGIVSTLEHLKYFFLKSNGTALSQYNEASIKKENGKIVYKSGKTALRTGGNVDSLGEIIRYNYRGKNSQKIVQITSRGDEVVFTTEEDHKLKDGAKVTITGAVMGDGTYVNPDINKSRVSIMNASGKNFSIKQAVSYRLQSGKGDDKVDVTDCVVYMNDPKASEKDTDEPKFPHSLVYTNHSNKYLKLVGGNEEVVEAGKFMDFEMFPTLVSLQSDNPNTKSKYVMVAALMRGKVRLAEDTSFGGMTWKKASEIDVETQTKYCKSTRYT